MDRSVLDANAAVPKHRITVRQGGPMSSPSIVAVISGLPDSLDAVRWAAWLSHRSGLPLTVVHTYHDTATGPTRERMRGQHELRERARAEEWLRKALDESPTLPHDLRLVATEGSLEDAIDPYLGEGGVLVTGSHGPAELVSWGCRIRGCPVVVVPSGGMPAGQELSGRARGVGLAAAEVQA